MHGTVLNLYMFVVDITHTMFGKFHFVDLAGSERAHRTGNVGDRFKGQRSNLYHKVTNYIYFLLEKFILDFSKCD